MVFLLVPDEFCIHWRVKLVIVKKILKGGKNGEWEGRMEDRMGNVSMLLELYV